MTTPKRIALLLLFTALVVQGVFFVTHGRFNIDEGMHVNAGRLIYQEGRLPYRDFPFSQGPGGPLFYGAGGVLFGDTIAVGRSLSLVVNLLALAAIMGFACRLSGAAGAALVALFTLVNLPAVWTSSQIRTEPPSVPLVALAAMALCIPKHSVLRWSLAPTLLVWATSARLTLMPVLIAICLWIAWELRHSRATLVKVSAVVALNGIVASLLMLAFLEESFFHIVSAQLDRTQRFGMDHFPASTRFRFFMDGATTFRPILLMSALPLFAVIRDLRRGWRPRMPVPDDPTSILACLLGMALVSYLPHLVFRIGFFNYFVCASVLLTLAVAIAVPRLAEESKRQAVWIGALALACWLSAAHTSWRHFEKWVQPEATTIDHFAELRERLWKLSPEGCTMLTFESYIAVEIGCDLTPGLEYSYFSFFPDLDREGAIAHGVLNRKLIAETISRGEPEFIVMTPRAVEIIEGWRPQSIDAPLLEAMKGRYHLLTWSNVPIGPVYEFEVRATVFVRNDLVEDPR